MCIAEALLRLETVVQARPNARQEQDEVIAFIDMKPPNILLDSQRGQQYPVYPKPLLSDFGAGHILYKEDPRQDDKHTDRYFHGATRGFLPPEMRVDTKEYGIQRGIQDRPLYSWTNVWQTGRTIECMMHLKQRMDHEKYSLVVDSDSYIKKTPPKFEKFPDFKYSDDLIDLVYPSGTFEADQTTCTQTQSWHGRMGQCYLDSEPRETCKDLRWSHQKVYREYEEAERRW